MIGKDAPCLLLAQDDDPCAAGAQDPPFSWLTWVMPLGGADRAWAIAAAFLCSLSTCMALRLLRGSVCFFGEEKDLSPHLP